jgi:hypothetical protein
MCGDPSMEGGWTFAVIDLYAQVYELASNSLRGGPSKAQNPSTVRE